MVDFWEKDEVVQKKNFWDDDEVVDVIGETLDTRARQSAMEAETVVEETKPQAVDTFMDKLTERLISLEKFSPTA
jgi:hypothetical protein